MHKVICMDKAIKVRELHLNKTHLKTRKIVEVPLHMRASVPVNVTVTILRLAKSVSQLMVLLLLLHPKSPMRRMHIVH